MPFICSQRGFTPTLTLTHYLISCNSDIQVYVTRSEQATVFFVSLTINFVEATASDNSQKSMATFDLTFDKIMVKAKQTCSAPPEKLRGSAYENVM